MYQLNGLSLESSQGFASDLAPVGGKYFVQLHSTTCYNSLLTLFDGKFSILFHGFSSPDRNSLDVSRVKMLSKIC